MSFQVTRLPVNLLAIPEGADLLTFEYAYLKEGYIEEIKYFKVDRNILFII
jgi:hypothetical protein